ncbi:glycoside hydrolase family 15 protein [Mycolicibacter sinensis]|jgi:GH15 family glucan-1,4-alpha-glucosidase|uniref:Trehalase n=1 Tax=Mycolicibacter sinensis (strain JDM601) TaxID=875328 RepID=A0A1A2EDU7_MYCSD|nr:glycoside hydrolase family 15 protein [Mycolicibacter sinensis]OBG00800.1 glucoamylase [Mycolicibacter sinensis]OBG02956.1 glucoamylase [Mycolicibacter sinensis]
MGSAPIEDYALLGDLHTAALLGRDGSIDWLCLPRFDSPACFAALLHDESAGYWRLAPAAGGPATRRGYRGDTLIVDSEWDTDGGTVRITDFMPPRGKVADVVRIVEGVSGRVQMRMDLAIRFDYGSVVPWVRRSDGGLIAVAGPDTVCLTSPVTMRGENLTTVAEFEVSAGEKVPFVLTHVASHLLPDAARSEATRALGKTISFWQNWIDQCSYRGQWSDAVRRAVITLKALTYAPTGGIVAAATTSLPECLGGVRNWDYRYCWLRDATFALQALLGTGYVAEAKAWREWLVRAVAGDPAKLQIMYGLDGTRRLPEQTLDWLSGYEGSAPVRVGNGAAGQFQLDVWGEVLDGLNLALDSGLECEDTAWDIQRALLDFLEGNWDRPDASLWEVRGPQRHFVHSKVMAWAGVDRAVHAVQAHGREGPVDAWRALAETIHADVCEHGFDAERGTFTQYYGSAGLDSALLLIPRVGFLPWDDPRVVGTVDAVQRELSSDGFLRRYETDDSDSDGDVDGLPGTEGAFLVCTFWLADALHGIGRRDEARALFERLLGLRNDVGLLSEEYDTAARRQIGNTPQAFSMVGLVNTARGLSGEATRTRNH